jgi:hypothetical protein
MNVAYKHLDAKLRIAELTIGQWVGVALGLCIGLGWGFFLSPFGTYLTLFSAIYLAAIPCGGVLGSALYEIDLFLVVRSALRWRRLDGRFVAGAGTTASGYRVLPAPVDPAAQRGAPPELELEDLWVL